MRVVTGCSAVGLSGGRERLNGFLCFPMDVEEAQIEIKYILTGRAFEFGRIYGFEKVDFFCNVAIVANR